MGKMLTIIIPIYNMKTNFDKCLTSLKDDTRTSLRPDINIQC